MCTTATNDTHEIGEDLTEFGYILADSKIASLRNQQSP